MYKNKKCHASCKVRLCLWWTLLTDNQSVRMAAANLAYQCVELWPLPGRGHNFHFFILKFKSKKPNKQEAKNEVLNKKWNILNNVWASLYQQAIMNLCCMPVLLVNGNDLYVRTDRNSDSSVLRSTYKVIRSIKEWLLYWIYCSLSIRVFIWLYKQGDHICNMVVDLGHPVLFSVGYSFTCMLQH